MKSCGVFSVETYRLIWQNHFILDAIFLSKRLFLLEIHESSVIVGRIAGNGRDDASSFVLLDRKHGQSVDDFIARQRCFER